VRWILQLNVQNAVEISSIFNFQVSPGSLVFTVEIESLLDTCTKFPWKSVSERIWKISVHLYTLWYCFLCLVVLYTLYTSSRQFTKTTHTPNSCSTSHLSCSYSRLAQLLQTESLEIISAFLANVNSRSRSLYAITRPSVVCNARAPYSGSSNFPQYFYGIWYLGHPLTSTENFTEIVPGEPLRRGS